MGKGGGDGFHTRYRPPSPPRAGRAQGPPPPRDRRPEGYRVSQVRRSEKFGGNATTAAVDGLQFPPDSSASQFQHPAGFSVGVEAGQDTELGAESVLPTSEFVVLDEVPKIWRQATERATSGVPNPDSEGLGGRNEGSDKTLVDQLHGAFHELDRVAGVLRGLLGNLLRRDRSQDHNLRQKPCENSLPNGEKAGESSSKGNVAESSDAPYAKPKKPSVSKKFPGVRRLLNGKFSAQIRLTGKKSRVWLGTFKTEEAACRAYQVAADWRKAHRGRKSFSEEEEDELKKLAKKAGEHLSDDRSHHNVDSPDLAATVASSKGKAVASAEPVSQRKSPAQQNSSTPDWGSLPEL